MGSRHLTVIPRTQTVVLRVCDRLHERHRQITLIVEKLNTEFMPFEIQPLIFNAIPLR